MLSVLGGSVGPLLVFPPAAGAGVDYGAPTLDLDFSALGLNDSDPISSIANAGSAGGSFTSASTARPLFKAGVRNGKAVARFDGINDTLTGSALSSYLGASAKTLLVVGRWTGGAWPAVTTWQAPAFFCDSGGYFGLHVNQTSGPQDSLVGYSYDGSYDYVPRMANGSWYVISLWHDGADLKLQLDAGSAGSVAAGATQSLAGSAVLGGVYDFLAGDVGRVLAYNSVLSDATRELYRDQLMSEWGW